MRILVTGGNGQLGQTFDKIASEYPGFQFDILDVDQLDITNEEQIEAWFSNIKPAWCINGAAYTAVDKAEAEKNLAAEINELGAKLIAEACAKHSTKLVHISTDFVFDGEKNTPYKETDEPNPLGVYGDTKRLGEYSVEQSNKDALILRTSWLYSEFGGNFVKTMIRLGTERDTLNVIYDQVGSPTYAEDLARATMTIIKSGRIAPGLYHFSNEGVASWYDFAKAIFDIKQIDCKLSPIETKDYPTPAKRPHYSLLNKSKIKETFGIVIPHWQDSLKKCLEKI